jgi:hypothetical protein
MAEAFVSVPKRFFEYACQHPEAEFFGLDNSGPPEEAKLALGSNPSDVAIAVANSCLEFLKKQRLPN